MYTFTDPIQLSFIVHVNHFESVTANHCIYKLNKFQSTYTDTHVQTHLRYSVYLLLAESISDPQSQRMESKTLNPHLPSVRLQDEVIDTGMFIF